MAHICSGLRFTSAPVSDRGALPHEPFRAAPRSLPPWYTLLASAPLVHTAPAPVSPSGSQSGRLTGEPCHTSPSAQPLGRSHLCHRRAPQSHIHLTCLHEPYRCRTNIALIKLSPCSALQHASHASRPGEMEGDLPEQGG
eukprot:2958842-Pyramimonas_sp.AAC.1